MEKDTLDLRETQDALNVSYQTLMQWLKVGQMSGHKVKQGKRLFWRIPVAEVERIRSERIAQLQSEIDQLRTPINGAENG